MKPKLLACMSGGRTSAYMTYKLLREKADEYDILVLFANTGYEHPATLEFVHQCDVQLGFNTVWVQAVPDMRANHRTRYEVVTYETASRIGKPFDAVCEKYGIPNKNYLHCTRELKEMPIHGYLWDIGWAKGEYITAIGMRADEPKRTKPKKPDRQTKQNKVYPLAHWWPTTKQDVLDFWEDWMLFDLGIPEHSGNCIFCHKKSEAKLLRAWQDNPEYFEMAAQMEERCCTVGPNVVPGPRKMFRGYRSTRDLIAMFSEAGNEYRPTYDDAPGGCTEECSPFSGDDDDDI